MPLAGGAMAGWWKWGFGAPLGTLAPPLPPGPLPRGEGEFPCGAPLLVLDQPGAFSGHDRGGVAGGQEAEAVEGEIWLDVFNHHRAFGKQRCQAAGGGNL